MSFADYWVCPSCKSLNRDRARQCYSCHTERTDDVSPGPPPPASGGPEPRPSWGLTAAGAPPPPATALASAGASAGNGIGFAAPVMPAATAQGVAAAQMLGGAQGVAPGGILADQGLVTSAPPPARPEPAGAANVLGGLIGGIAGAMIATLLWYGVVVLTNYEVGLIAIAVGAIVGFGVLFGAGGRASFVLLPISVGLTFGALVVSEYLILVRLVNDAFVSGGIDASLPLVNPPDIMVRLVVAGIQDDPGTLLFWGIALFEAFVIPWRRIMSGR